MLDTTPELTDLLERARTDIDVQPFVAEFITITGPDGTVLARWNDSDTDLAWSGNVYAARGNIGGVRGPGIAASQVSKQAGTQAAQFDLTLYMDEGVLLNGRTLSAFIAGGGFFQSVLLFEEAYAEKSGRPVLGTIPLFTGKVTQLRGAGATQATLTAMDWRNLLNVQVPVNNFQTNCLHTVFDSGCTLKRDNFKVLGSVEGGDALTLSTSITAPDGYLNLGEIVFTGGANKGLHRSVKVQNAGGSVSLVVALPNTPQPGDPFIGYPGCDLTMAMCRAKFNNIAHFKGQPYVPLNEQAAP